MDQIIPQVGFERGVRPMVEVNLNSVTVGATGSGTSTSPYSMAKN